MSISDRGVHLVGQGLATLQQGVEGLMVDTFCGAQETDYAFVDIPHLHEAAITADEAAAEVLDGVIEGRFFITTRAYITGRFRDNPLDPSACIDLLVQFRKHALALRPAALASR